MLPQGVMDLLPDAVPNVRLAALGLLPALKQTIRLPEDVQHLVRKVIGLHHVDVHVVSAAEQQRQRASCM